MRRHRFCLMLMLALVSASLAAGGQVVSKMRNVSAYMEYAGFQLTPIGTQTIPGDQSAAQLFEITRPGYGPVTVGRLYTSCTCIQASAQKRKFGAGEQAIIMLRNVRPTTGKTYPFYVQITSPIRATLRFDAYVISDQFATAPAVVEPEPVITEEPDPAETAVAEPEATEEAPAAATESEAKAEPEAATEATADETPEAGEPAEAAEEAAESHVEEAAAIVEAIEQVEEAIASEAVDAVEETEETEAAEPAATPAE